MKEYHSLTRGSSVSTHNNVIAVPFSKENTECE